MRDETVTALGWSSTAQDHYLTVPVHYATESPMKESPTGSLHITDSGQWSRKDRRIFLVDSKCSKHELLIHTLLILLLKIFTLYLQSYLALCTINYPQKTKTLKIYRKQHI